MSERFSRYLMIAEFAICVVTVANIWLCILFYLPEVIGMNSWEIGAALVAVLLLATPQVALARLALTLAVRGSSRLRAIPDHWWLAASSIAGIALVGIAAQVIVLATGNEIHEIVTAGIRGVAVPNDEYGMKAMTARVIDVASIGVWFTPLLVPIVHVWLERNRKHAL